jgi:hypothetical protein
MSPAYVPTSKKTVVPIHCDEINLDDILEGILATRTSFPLKYLGLPLSVWKLKHVDFQHLEDKCARKLPSWGGKYITTTGHTTLVKSVITSQATYYLTPLVVPPGTFKFINKIKRALLLSAKDTTTRAKCKVNWKTVCCPKKLGGLGVMCLDKFVAALRLRWPWLEWTDSSKIWAGSSNPCSKRTWIFSLPPPKSPLETGARIRFGMLIGLKEEIRRILRLLSLCVQKRKSWKVNKALEANTWVGKINLDENFTIHHLSQYINLWAKLQEVHLIEEIEDTISWRLMTND